MLILTILLKITNTPPSRKYTNQLIQLAATSKTVNQHALFSYLYHRRKQHDSCCCPWYQLSRSQESPIFLHPLRHPRLTVSIGSSNCASQGNVLITIYNQILNFNPNIPYVDGTHIACSKNTCAFYQNLPVSGTNTAGQAATHVKNLLDHGW